MNTVLIIGAGGVGHVVANKCAQLPDIFQNIHLASRTKSKCDAIADDVRARTDVNITTHAVNADDVPPVRQRLSFSLCTVLQTAGPN